MGKKNITVAELDSLAEPLDICLKIGEEGVEDSYSMLINGNTQAIGAGLCTLMISFLNDLDAQEGAEMLESIYEVCKDNLKEQVLKTMMS